MFREYAGSTLAEATGTELRDLQVAHGAVSRALSEAESDWLEAHQALEDA